MKDKISIVTSLYRSSSFINEFYSRHLACLNSLDVDFEFVFVNDGSPDNSADVVRSIIDQCSKTKLIDLSRNFGQHAAMFAGLEHADGDYVFALDCDLEERPENIVEFYKYIKAYPDVDVVYGVLSKRTGGFVRNFLGSIFYKILDIVTEIKIPHDQAWQRLMTHNYVQALIKFQECDSLPAGLMALTGFKQFPIEIEKMYKGHSTYSFKKRFVLAFNSIVAFSAKPLVLIMSLGFMITLLSVIASLYLIITALFYNQYRSGWVSVIVSVWLIGGLLLLSIGVVGIYISKIFNQTKKRPKYLIKELRKNRT